MKWINCSTNHLLLILLIGCTSCVSSGNLFQDGHTAGKKKHDVAVSISEHLVPHYKTDSASRSVTLKPYRLPAPWLQLQYQHGFMERLDLGCSFGFGLFTVGFEGYAKIALLPRTSKLGVSVMGLAGFATLNADVSQDGETIDQAHWLLAMPMSYQVAPKSAVVVQPIVAWENYKYHFPDPDGAFRGKTDGKIYKLGLGWIQHNPKKSKIFYNLTMNYVPQYDRLFPTFGVAALPAWGD